MRCVRQWLLVMLFLILAGSLSTTAAERMNQEESLFLKTIEAGDISITWRDLGRKKGEKLPVYSAPFENAWRGANGKAAVFTGEPFRVLGTAQNGKWAWIEYEVDSKNRRVGWIQASYKPSESDPNCFPADGALLMITSETFLTDDPRGGRREIRKLYPGDKVIGLAKVQWADNSSDGWIYSETEIDGRPVWGFLPVNAAEKLPSYRIEGDTIIYQEGVTTIGDSQAADYLEDNETGNYEIVWRTFEPGEIQGESIISDLGVLPTEANRIVYPSTLTILGGEAVCFGQWKEIVMPEHLKQCDLYAFYGLSAEKVVFPKAYAGPVFFDDRCTIGAFEAAEGNQAYKTTDGILYSADGKTLLRYPNGRPDEHFDVPAGVEAIGPNAFADDHMGIPLKTISLPMGLKEIDKRAFSGCGRLQSLTVPLTVTTLDRDAFADCVSLERLSLPPGLSVNFGGDWAEYGDFSVYNGDNGGTAAVPRQRSEWETDPDGFSIRMMLIPKEGETGIPVYPDAESKEKIGFRHPGETVWIELIQGSRMGSREYLGYQEDSNESICQEQWFDRGNLTGVPGYTLFSEPDISFAADTWQTDQGRTVQPGQSSWHEEEYTRGTVTFTFPQIDADQLYEEEFLTLPFADCIFRRKDGDPEGILGVLYSGEGQVILSLRETPEGPESIRVPVGTQARVLESRSGWILAETAAGSGWIAERNFQEVPPADRGT